MEEIRKIIIQHSRKYPQMQPQDFLKLVYQNEFGPGHFVTDAEACLDWIRKEYRETQCKPQFAAENIGNGLVRVYFSILDESVLPKIRDCFMATAILVSGNRDSFMRKLEILRSLAETHQIALDRDALEEYLAGYDFANCPAVSHSQVYCDSYHPAYRVVSAALFRQLAHWNNSED